MASHFHVKGCVFNENLLDYNGVLLASLLCHSPGVCLAPQRNSSSLVCQTCRFDHANSTLSPPPAGHRLYFFLAPLLLYLSACEAETCGFTLFGGHLDSVYTPSAQITDS